MNTFLRYSALNISLTTLERYLQMGEQITWLLHKLNRPEKEQIPPRHERVEKLNGLIEDRLEPIENNTGVLPTEVQVEIKSTDGVINIVGYPASGLRDLSSQFPDLSFSAQTPTVVNTVELPNGKTYILLDLHPHEPTRKMEVYCTTKPGPDARFVIEAIKLGSRKKGFFIPKDASVGGVVEETSRLLLDRRIREIGLDPDAMRLATDEEIASLTALLESL